MMKKKEKAEDDEDQPAEAGGNEEENEDANTANDKPSVFAALKKRATNAAKNALAKVGLAEEAEEDPVYEEEEEDGTPKKRAPVAQNLGEVTTVTCPKIDLLLTSIASERTGDRARRDLGCMRFWDACG